VPQVRRHPYSRNKPIDPTKGCRIFPLARTSEVEADLCATAALAKAGQSGLLR